MTYRHICVYVCVCVCHTQIPPDKPESQAKEDLVDEIREFVRSRIEQAQVLVANLAAEKVRTHTHTHVHTCAYTHTHTHTHTHTRTHTGVGEQEPAQTHVGSKCAHYQGLHVIVVLLLPRMGGGCRDTPLTFLPYIWGRSDKTHARTHAYISAQGTAMFHSLQHN